MEIKLELLRLTMFKAIKALTIPFKEKTNIGADNEVGKSTIFDAFTWLLFGKNSLDQADFNIKTLDSNNNPIHKANHEVEGIITVDGMENKFKRIYKEKWSTKRGSDTPEMTGHETLFFHNEVPLSKADYEKKIASIIPESTFKLITSPAYFHSINWQNRRTMLFTLAGEIDEVGLLEQFAELKKILNSGKSLVEYKKENAAKIRLFKESLEAIPSRIDEVIKGMPAPINEIEVTTEIKLLEAKIDTIDKVMKSKYAAVDKKNKEIQEKNTELFNLKGQLSELEFEQSNKGKKELYEYNAEVEKINRLIKSCEQEIGTCKNEAKTLKERYNYEKATKDELLKVWQVENEQEFVFNDAECICPTCKRPLEAADIEVQKKEMSEAFYTSKNKNLESINKQGFAKKELIESIAKQEFEKQSEITKAEQNLKELKSQLLKLKKPDEVVSTDSPEIIKLRASIEEITAKIGEPAKADISGLKLEKENLIALLDEQKAKLIIKEVIKKAEARKEELEKEQKTLAMQIADLEKIGFQIEQFTKKKIELVEDKINSQFNYVKFKMYNQLINGGEEECCITLINGVPYNDANNAAKINAGIDIINTFSRFYDITAPIFVDNAEAVNEIIDTPSQLIRLIVTKDKTLKIS